MNNLSNLLAKAEAFSTPTPLVISDHTYSFGIVNSKNNGKRLTLSKALSKKLDIKDDIAFLPMPDDGVLLISSQLPLSVAINATCKGEDKKIVYSATLVQHLTSAFKLDFSNRTSVAFSDIKFETNGDLTAAIVTINSTEA